jgi:hypothetical protein
VRAIFDHAGSSLPAIAIETPNAVKSRKVRRGLRQ